MRLIMGLWASMLIAPLGWTADYVEFINSDQARAANRPFSEAVRVGDMLYLSGAIGIKPGASTPVPGGIVPEMRQIMENISTVLEANKATLDEVVKCTVMLADIDDYAAMNEVYVEYFPRDKPARSTFAAEGLALGAKAEVECWAVLD
jgi:2-iminobutanoate/2-iminopropanoate deaminase